MSHLSAIRQAFIDRCEHCIISEDDASFALVRHWHVSLYALANRIGSETPGIINLFNPKTYPDSDVLVRGYPESGTVGYIINQVAMKKINDFFFNENIITIPKIQGVDRPTSDLLLYRFIGNSFMTAYPYVYPYNVELMSTIHDDHTIGHLKRAADAIIKTVTCTLHKQY